MDDIGKDFEEDVKIDKHNLAEAAEEQPSLYQYYLEQAGELRKERDKQKDKVAFLEAEKDIEIRRDPPDGLKMTEAVVKNLVATDSGIEGEREELRRIQSELVSLEAATSALEHRNAQIKVLKDLWIAGYYSDPDQKGSMDAGRAALNRKKNKEEN